MHDWRPARMPIGRLLKRPGQCQHPLLLPRRTRYLYAHWQARASEPAGYRYGRNGEHVESTRVPEKHSIQSKSTLKSRRIVRCLWSNDGCCGCEQEVNHGEDAQHTTPKAVKILARPNVCRSIDAGTHPYLRQCLWQVQLGALADELGV